MAAFQGLIDASEETSFDAAQSDFTTQRQAVLTMLRKAGDDGLTDDEGCVLLGMRELHVYSNRRLELFERGFVEPTQLKRKTRSGKNAVVWISVPEERRVEVIAKWAPILRKKRVDQAVKRLKRLSIGLEEIQAAWPVEKAA